MGDEIILDDDLFSDPIEVRNKRTGDNMKNGNADIEVSIQVATTAISKHKQNTAPKWSRASQQNLNHRGNCAQAAIGGCGQRIQGQAYVPQELGHWVCKDCWDKNQLGDTQWVENVVKELVKSTKNSRAAKTSANKKKMNSIEAKAQPYIDIGLGKPFAEAIAKDMSIANSVMDLWEADWWRQYEDDDVLIVAVLDGVIPEDDGQWLNTIRSDHEDLVIACIHEHCTVDWARALIDCGLEGHSEAITSILHGGEPSLVARIAEIDVNSEIVPPAGKPFPYLLNNTTEKKK